MNLMPRSSGARLTRTTIFFSLTAVLVQMLLLFPLSAIAQQDVQWDAQEKPIFDQIKTLRSLPDDVRARTTKDIAVEIRALPASENKLRLAVYLASRATEGDCGHDTLQEVTTTLAGRCSQRRLIRKARPLPRPTMSWHNWRATSTCRFPLTRHNSKQRWRSWKPPTSSASKSTLR